MRQVKLFETLQQLEGRPLIPQTVLPDQLILKFLVLLNDLVEHVAVLVVHVVCCQVYFFEIA